MGFSPKVKSESLSLSARHCSVCHRYKGIKMEVHHIIQEADGGPNTLDNAIPLCFDCHCDAGHYNNRHPKGTKFSIQELTKSRDAWYKIVSEKSIPEKLIISEHIQVNYFVLHTLEILEKTLKQDFTSINYFGGNCYLQQNEISEFWSSLLKSHEQDFEYNIEQKFIVELSTFSSITEYEDEYDDVTLIDKSSTDYPYYAAKRNVSWSELINSNIPSTFITVLKECGVDSADMFTALLHKYSDPCGGDELEHEFIEYLEISPISFVFLGITNATKEQLKLNILRTNDSERDLPNFNVKSKDMVLIPISTAINLIDIDEESIRLKHSGRERGEDFSRVLNPKKFDADEVIYIGSKIVPSGVTYNTNEGEYELDMHVLDFKNLYSINSYWQCGSCPHLFFRIENGLQEYSRELLVSSSNKIGDDSFIIPNGVSYVLIRELEDEITILKKVIVNDIEIISNKELHKGEYIEFPVSQGDLVKLIGMYVPYQVSISKENDKWLRNKLISNSNKVINGLEEPAYNIV